MKEARFERRIIGEKEEKKRNKKRVKRKREEKGT